MDYANTGNISTHLQETYIKCEHYKIWLFGQHINVSVTSDPQSARSWIRKSLHIHRHRLQSCDQRRVIVGLGTQWYPYDNPLPAIIQICIGRRVLIYQILRSRSIIMPLNRLLADRRITFVGYNIGYDCSLLKKFYGLTVASTAELRSVSGMGNASIEKMVERYLGFPGVKKNRQVSISNWEAKQLSVDQVEYAALDVYFSFQLGVELVAKQRVFECNAVFGDAMTTRGYIADHDQDGVSESRSYLHNFDVDESDSYSGSVDRVYGGGAVTSGFYADHQVLWDEQSESVSIVDDFEKVWFFLRFYGVDCEVCSPIRTSSNLGLPTFL